MKLATYVHKHITSCGIITKDGIIDIPSHTEGMNKLHSVKEILIKGQKAFDIVSELHRTVDERIPAESVVFKAPIPRPGKVLALAGNYKEHLQETAWQDPTFDNQAAATNPWPFIMPASAVTGTNTEIAWPAYSEQVDYEVELAIIIGNSADKVTPERAPAHIAGYSVANDISARSTTFAAGRTDRPRDVYFDWLMGKWANGFLPLGPCIVIPETLGDPHNLNLELKVNGEIRQQSNTSQMIFDVYKIVSFISHLMTLEPGDVIITGTPHGVAAGGAEYLKPHDIMEATIQNIGTLTNTIGAKPEKLYRGFIQ